MLLLIHASRSILLVAVHRQGEGSIARKSKVWQKTRHFEGSPSSSVVLVESES